MIFDLIRKKPKLCQSWSIPLTQKLDYHVTNSAILALVMGLPSWLLWAQTLRDFTEVFYLSVNQGALKPEYLHKLVRLFWQSSSDELVQTVWTNAATRELCLNPLGTGWLWKGMVPLQENFIALRWVSAHLSHQGAHCNLNVHSFCLSGALINC